MAALARGGEEEGVENPAAPGEAASQMCWRKGGGEKRWRTHLG